MSVTQTIDSRELVAFVERASREFAQAARVLKDTRTLSATNTFQAFQRVPGTELVVALSAPSPWAASQEIQPVVVTFDGDVLHGDARAGGNGPRYGAGFDLRAVLLDSMSARAPGLPDFTTVKATQWQFSSHVWQSELAHAILKELESNGHAFQELGSRVACLGRGKKLYLTRNLPESV
ncbi:MULTISPECIES: hypothetical protein [Burkholderia cepacia complex]|uniref:hypothetical protein n=1 Tax=Burkholderia cepacia complex TaxID=87882 RepID=UPI001F0BC9B1|nr:MULTISPECIES: hypothetical protein [Burkholderia cepacia complex]